MIVTVHVKAFYDWAPVPADVQVKETDIKSGRVRPAKAGGHLMRVTREAPSHTTITIPEHALVQKLIYELIPRPALRKLGACNRKTLVAELLDANVMPDHAHPKHFTDFTVECDQGPDEALLRSELAKYIAAEHHLTGEPLIDPNDVEAIVAKYMEPATHDDHKEHLHARFGVAKKTA